MKDTSCGTNDVVLDAFQKYADMVRRICFLYLRERSDVEDVFQDVFLKLIKNADKFKSEEHKKAWLCRVTINQCKDYHNSFFRRNVCSLNDVDLLFEDEKENEVIKAVLELPSKYKDVIYLYYYEGYSVPEIALMMDKKENTIYSHLHRAKILLKDKLGGLYCENDD